MAMLPPLTQFAFDLADLCRTCWPVIVVVAAGVLWLDHRFSTWLHRRCGTDAARIWRWGVALILVDAILTLLFAMFLPGWHKGRIAIH